MNRTFYACLLLVMLQYTNNSSLFGQASVFSQKRGGVMISIDDTPVSDDQLSTWESYRLLFNKYGYKFNIALQSEGLNRPAVAAKVKQMMSDGHEMMDHCPQDNVSEFRFNTHMEDSALYIKNGIKQPGVESVNIGKDLVIVTLKTGASLDPSAIPVLAERTRLLYRRYLKDSTNYPKVLAQPGDGTSVSQIDGYIFLKQAGYTAAAYDGLGKDNVITKTYNISEKLFHPAFNIKRADWGDMGNFQSTTKEVADKMAKHQVVSILFHYPSIPGLLDVTDKFLKWCQDNDIPLLTISQWMTNLYNSYPDPTTNVFPDITKDRNGDNKPDGYENFDQNVTINKTDTDAPGGSSLTKNAWGNLLQITALGGIEKGKNIISFSAKGQLNATIRIKALINGIGQTYCDTTINLDSQSWKTYKAPINVPENANFSDISFALENITSSSSFVSISNWQLSKVVKQPTIKVLSDTTITIKQAVSLSAEPGCTNYRWSTGATTQNIVFDGAKSGPGTFPVSYTADDASRSLIADKATITVKGLLSSPQLFLFPTYNSNATLKITANIPWTITSKNNLVIMNPSNGISSADVVVSMLENATVQPVNDTIIISSSQTSISIPVHQPGLTPLLSINKTSFNTIPRKGIIETIQLTSNTKWRISSKPSWISSSLSTGNGNALITFTIDSNKLVTERTENIIIKAPNGDSDSLNVSITAYQMGEDHYLNLDNNTFSVKAPANTVTFHVTSNTKWILSGMPDWIKPKTITGTGNGDVAIDLKTNSLRTERIGTFKLSTSNDTTRIVTVKQAGADYIDIDKKAIQVSAASKAETISITSSTLWNVSNKSTWLTVTPSSGSNNYLLALAIQENLKADTRIDTVTVKAKDCPDQTIVVTQTGASPKVEIDKSTITVIAAANVATLKITSNTTWTITDVPTWIKPSQLSGDGNVSINLSIDQNKLKTERSPATLKITPKNGTFVLLEVKQEASPSLIISTPESITIGPANGDTTSIFVTSNVKWKVINSLGWIKTNPEAWISIDGDKRLNITLNTQWLSQEDITGVDKQGTFTLEEESTLPNKIIKTIVVTLKSIPAVLKVPKDTITFKKIESTTIKIESNLPWTAEKKTNANWLKINPTFSSGGSIDFNVECITNNAGSKDNSVYIILKQTKGVIKDSILIIQAGRTTGIRNDEQSKFKIYPQPALETLNIDLPENNNLKYWNIYNPIGVELLNGRFENKNKLQIPINKLRSGVYFITLRSDSNNIGLKFTK